MVSTSTKFVLNKRTLDKKSVPVRGNEWHSIENPFPLAGKLFPLLGTEKIEENWFSPNFSNAF